jgi:crotonobetainyl-CoA:carnitine CoA-transferase CaiB-like acyl-CoA transferase
VLEGIRIVSFCHYLQGPAGAQYLADMGADVIKVEPPGGAFERHWAGAKAFIDGLSAFYLAANRNKRSIAVDLKHPDGKAVIVRLLERADVLMENFRPGTMERLGLGYDEVKSIRPDIIYASATGFGSSGPMVARPGQDLLIQAYSGLIASTGHLHERPVPIGFAVADQHGAALLAMGILGAYVKKLRTGRGTRVEACLLNAGLDLQTESLTLYLSGGFGREKFRRDRNLATWFHEAPYGVYRCADCWLAVSLNNPHKLARALQSPRLAEIAHLDRHDERDRYAETLAEELRDRRFADLAAGFEAQAIWYQRVHEYDQLRDDPQIRHNQMFREVPVPGGTATLVNHPNRYDGEVPPLRRLALAIGEDTREVLGELGYAPAEIDDLVARGAIAAPARTKEATP